MMTTGVVLSYGVGMSRDYIFPVLRDLGIDAGAGTAWDVSQYVWIQTNLMYFCLLLPSALGIIIFIISVTRRQRRDEFVESGAIYHQEE